ncbi:MAG: hemolysin family protein [Verrucomicrobiae bacterium]|nr:hemolysin family protein [Verrucomicrobiae bacterium]
MERAPWIAALAVLLCAAASFFFALAETALLSLARWQVRQLAERHPHRGGVVARLIERPQDLLAALVLGNTFAVAGMLAVALWMALEGRWPLLGTVGALLALILIGGEVVPKTLAVRRPDLWALRVAPGLLVFERVAMPLSWLARRLNELILRLLVPASVKPQTTLTDAEYQELLELAAQQGALAASEKEIILQIIHLDRRTAREVMKPRAQMACISDDLSIEEMIEAARRYKHRRLPIYDETPDTIVGILNTRTLLLNPDGDLADAIEFPSFVPETMNLLQLFKSLQRQQRGMAIVLDEFGGTAGLVTMEDILGELVGRIRGEMPAEGLVMERLGPGRWRVSGTLRLDDFRREYPALGEVPEVETMGGLLMHLLGVVPAPGESATFRGLKLTARVTDERRVKELLVEQFA